MRKNFVRQCQHQEMQVGLNMDQVMWAVDPELSCLTPMMLQIKNSGQEVSLVVFGTRTILQSVPRVG